LVDEYSFLTAEGKHHYEQLALTYKPQAENLGGEVIELLKRTSGKGVSYKAIAAQMVDIVDAEKFQSTSSPSKDTRHEKLE
jgi:hypothetical protein